MIIVAALINDPEAHKPHGPRFGTAYEDGVVETGQGFYQPPGEEQRKRLEGLPETAKDADSFDIAIDDYQAWCELNWKKPHGTKESIERFVAKLAEENAELKEEFYRQDRDKELISEIGDLAWCVAAISSDLRINIKHGLLDLFYSYGQGTVIYETAQPPPWVKQAQALTFDKSLKAGGIDSLMDKGYEPQQSPIMFVDDSAPITDLELEDARNNIEINSVFLSSIAKMNYEDDLYQSGATRRVEQAAFLAARIYIDLAFIAKHRAGSSLNEVIRMNILKLSKRVEDGRVDKSDGARDD